jgi:hypothetical protein
MLESIKLIKRLTHFRQSCLYNPLKNFNTSMNDDPLITYESYIKH